MKPKRIENNKHLSSDELSRRDFVTNASVTAGGVAFFPEWIPASCYGSNDRIRVGIVGAGVRGKALITWASKLKDTSNIELTAVCDIWNKRRVEGAVKIKQREGKSPATYCTLDELCNQSDTDAILIATADFQHTDHAAKAVKAGKDVYVEKPFGCDFNQIKLATQTIAQSNRIVQMGTQSRGNGLYYGIRDVIKSGAVGKITYGEIYDCVNHPQWQIPNAETSIKAEDTNWKEFLTYLDEERYPWNPRHYREFRLFWPFSSGPFCQWMSHRIDLVNLLLDSAPKYAVAWGGVYLWQDGRTNPDTVQCLLEYPDGIMITYHMRMGNEENSRGILLYGTEGTIDLQSKILKTKNGQKINLNRVHQKNSANQNSTKDEIVIPHYPDKDHLEDFFECIRNRRQPRANIEAGFNHALATTMANTAYRTGCRVAYDSQSNEICLSPVS